MDKEYYFLKFLSLPKEAKKLKVLPLNQLMNLTDANLALQALIDKAGKSGVTRIQLDLKLFGQAYGKAFDFTQLELELAHVPKGNVLDYLLTNDILESVPKAPDAVKKELDQLSDELAFQFQDENIHPTHYVVQGKSKNAHKRSFLSVIRDRLPKGKDTDVSVEAVERGIPQPEEKEVPVVPPPTATAVVYDDELETTQEFPKVGNVPTTTASDYEPPVVDWTAPKKGENTRTTPLPSTQAAPHMPTNGTPQAFDLKDYYDIHTTEIDQQLLTMTKELKEKDTSEQAYLVQKLGIHEQSMDRLEQRKAAFIAQEIQANYFQQLAVDLENEVNRLKKASMDTLESVYAGSQLDQENYLTEIASFETSKLQELTEAAEEKVKAYETELEETTRQQQQHLKATHQRELDALKEKHRLELQAFQQERQQTEHASLATFKEQVERHRKEELQESLSSHKERTLERERRRLEEEKIKVLHLIERNLPKIRKKFQDQETQYISDLKAKLHQAEPQLKEEVQQDLENEQREKELALAEQRNALKEKEIALQAREQDHAITEQVKQEELLQQMIQQQSHTSMENNKLMTDLLQTVLLTQQQTQSRITPPAEGEDTPSKKAQPPSSLSSNEKKPLNKRLLVGGSVLALLLIGSFSYVTYQSQANRTLLATMQSDIQTHQEQVATSQSEIDSLKEALATSSSSEQSSPTNGNTSTQSSEEPLATDILSLLQRKEYMQAAAMYPDQLDMIEQQLFATDDVEGLKTFNTSYPSSYGLLDQAILENDQAKVKQLYDYSIPKKFLSNRQKEAIAQVLSSAGRDYEATALLGK